MGFLLAALARDLRGHVWNLARTALKPEQAQHFALVGCGAPESVESWTRLAPAEGTALHQLAPRDLGEQAQLGRLVDECDLRHARLAAEVRAERLDVRAVLLPETRAPIEGRAHESAAAAVPQEDDLGARKPR